MGILVCQMMKPKHGNDVISTTNNMLKRFLGRLRPCNCLFFPKKEIHIYIYIYIILYYISHLEYQSSSI